MNKSTRFFFLSVLLLFFIHLTAPVYGFSSPELEQISQSQDGIKTAFDGDSKVLRIESVLRLKTLEIYNILGQKTMTKRLDGYRAYTQLAELSRGVYIAKIKAENATKTIKLVVK